MEPNSYSRKTRRDLPWISAFGSNIDRAGREVEQTGTGSARANDLYGMKRGKYTTDVASVRSRKPNGVSPAGESPRSSVSQWTLIPVTTTPAIQPSERISDSHARTVVAPIAIVSSERHALRCVLDGG